MNDFWSDDDVATAKRMWFDERKSFSDIGAVVNRSRRSVAGKLMRISKQEECKRPGVKVVKRTYVRKAPAKKVESKVWTYATLERARELYFADVLTNAQIAAQVGRTLAALTWQITRLGWAKQRSTPRYTVTPQVRKTRVNYSARGSLITGPASTPGTLPTTEIMVFGTVGVHIDGLNLNTCRWPLCDDLTDMVYCGGDCRDEDAYCAGHVALAYRRKDDGHAAGIR